MSNLDRTAQLFRRHRRCWISAMQLMTVGGWCVFRTRISECRTLLGMTIENKTERTPTGARSWYRYTGKAVARG